MWVINFGKLNLIAECLVPQIIFRDIKYYIRIYMKFNNISNSVDMDESFDAPLKNWKSLNWSYLEEIKFIHIRYIFTQKKDLIESKKMLCLKDFIWLKKLFIWIKLNWFDSNKYLFGPKIFLFKLNKCY